MVEAMEGYAAVALGPGDLMAALSPEDGLSVGEAWDFEIYDESQVPDEFWGVSEKKIKAAVAITKKHTKIPGVRVFPKPKVAFR